MKTTTTKCIFLLLKVTHPLYPGQKRHVGCPHRSIATWQSKQVCWRIPCVLAIHMHWFSKGPLTSSQRNITFSSIEASKHSTLYHTSHIYFDWKLTIRLCHLVHTRYVKPHMFSHYDLCLVPPYAHRFLYEIFKLFTKQFVRKLYMQSVLPVMPNRFNINMCVKSGQSFIQSFIHTFSLTFILHKVDKDITKKEV